MSSKQRTLLLAFLLITLISIGFIVDLKDVDVAAGALPKLRNDNQTSKNVTTVVQTTKEKVENMISLENNPKEIAPSKAMHVVSAVSPSTQPSKPKARLILPKEENEQDYKKIIKYEVSLLDNRAAKKNASVALQRKEEREGGADGATKSDDQEENQPLSFLPYTNESLIIAIQPQYGRFGNKLFQYASPLGIYLLMMKHNRGDIHLCLEFKKGIRETFAGPFPPYCNHTLLMNQHRTISWIQESGFGKFTNYSTSLVADYRKTNCPNANKTTPCVVGFQTYLQSYKYFAHADQVIKASFRPNQALREKVDDVWNGAAAAAIKANNNRNETTVFVGIHVRRGDTIKYSGMMMMNSAPMSYYVDAMRRMRQKYSNVMFLLASDDKAFCRNQTNIFGNAAADVLILPDDLHYTVDFAVLAECHHFIMGVGTFGWWAGYLTGGEVIYYKRPMKPDHPLTIKGFRMEDCYPPSWVAM